MTYSEYIPSASEAMAAPPGAPSSADAELAVLGAVFFDPARAGECLEHCLTRFGSEEVFFDLRHQSIYNAMLFLRSQGKPVDEITVSEELKSRGSLEQCGGIAFLSGLAAKAESPANIVAHIEIVWDKFVARRLIEKNRLQIEIVERAGGASEALIARVDDEHQRFKKLIERGAVSPKNLCRPADFGEPYYDAWFKREQETYGWELPFKFPMRIRPSEMTIFSGDNGSGKSSMLGLIAIVCGKQFGADQRIVIASMEVPPEITLWIMARQLLGIGRLECTEENIFKITRALSWLNKRVLLYNFLGITDWRELLNTFRYARKQCGGVIFIVDSVMRIGIQDDDYAMQGVVAAQFADFCVKEGAHTFLVVHENKGEGRAKDRVRGSKQWTDNAHNVCAMKRNEAKAEKVEEWKAELAAGEIDQEAFNGKMEGIRKTWDAKFILSKQRWPGSQQNASRWLYFDHGSLQFHEQPGDRPFDFTIE